MTDVTPKLATARVWSCGLCSTPDRTISTAGGLCRSCRQQPPLPAVNDLSAIGGER